MQERIRASRENNEEGGQEDDGVKCDAVTRLGLATSVAGPLAARLTMTRAGRGIAAHAFPESVFAAVLFCHVPSRSRR
ncbi:MAG: hypothetical protein WCC04_17300, partial [Terriglobales bacterium]